jgi:hypothetical protein
MKVGDLNPLCPALIRGAKANANVLLFEKLHVESSVVRVRRDRTGR